MNVRMATIACATIAIGADAFAIPKPKPIYSIAVSAIRRSQKNIPDRPVYVDGTVASPGAYPFKDGMTVAEFVRQAGGIKGSMTQIEFLKKVGFNVTVSGTQEPTTYPTEPDNGWISLYHPRKEDPNPEVSGTCQLNVKKKPNMAIELCTRRPAENDLIFVFVHKPGPLVGP